MTRHKSSLGVRVLQVGLVVMVLAGLWLALIAPSDTGMVLAFSDPQFPLAKLPGPLWLLYLNCPENDMDRCEFLGGSDAYIVASCDKGIFDCNMNPTIKAQYDAAVANLGHYPSGIVAGNPACGSSGASCPPGVAPWVQVTPGPSGGWVPVGTVSSSTETNIVVYTTTVTTSTVGVTTTFVTTVTQTIPAYSLVPDAVGVMQWWGLLFAGIGGSLGALTIFKPKFSAPW